MDRHWSARLSGAEYKIVCHIFDRTYAWGNVYEEISVREFVRGRNGYTAGTGLSERTVVRTIQSLMQKGVVFREEHPGAMCEYAIDITWRGPDEDIPEMEL